MNISSWHIWIIISIILLIVEVIAPTFLAMCLAVGCIASAFVSSLGFEIEVQLLAFSIGSLISFFTIRPVMLKYAHEKGNKIKTNVDALVGKTGRVVLTIDSDIQQGRVLVEGDDWRAESEDDAIILEGERIEVVKVNSTILIVKHIIKT